MSCLKNSPNDVKTESFTVKQFMKTTCLRSVSHPKLFKTVAMLARKTYLFYYDASCKF